MTMRESLTEPKINVPLLKRTLAFIKLHPRSWDQMDYRCGTVCCFAGHAALLAGGKWKNPKERYDDFLEADEKRGWWEQSAHNRARRVLGLSEYQANELFSGSNSFGKLKEQVDALVRIGTKRTKRTKLVKSKNRRKPASKKGGKSK